MFSASHDCASPLAEEVLELGGAIENDRHAARRCSVEEPRDFQSGLVWPEPAAAARPPESCTNYRVQDGRSPEPRSTRSVRTPVKRRIRVTRAQMLR